MSNSQELSKPLYYPGGYVKFTCQITGAEQQDGNDSNGFLSIVAAMA